jgi:hypothetical protein
MTAATMGLFAEMLRHQGELLIDIAGELADVAKLKGAQPRCARGFQIVKDWDGSGVLRDGAAEGHERILIFQKSTADIFPSKTVVGQGNRKNAPAAAASG